ncbi:mercury ion transport protein MerF [Thalassoporum mexicanum PCC 7367]|uniref:mercury resistance system transport protein MerF n=1 Tax=Thalassoporum mexicanum TaxID=3457544 RepID=UPI00029FDCC6|nr:mercury resistance system transport protein MerF [Pseudanabaena sp. PCC 7367]AFY70467.1 mercury ion transport protein MerF [Pseudanabaena sp. PCC 7367]
MKSKNALIASIVGTIVVAICCFTPILVLFIGLLGWGAFAGYLDYILLPLLLGMILLTTFSYIRYRQHCRFSR